MISDFQRSFSGGEFAPLLHYRDDLAKHSSAIREGRNLLASPYGPVSKRPGTLYVSGSAEGATHQSRLIAWQISASEGYVIELSESVARFFKEGAPVMDGGSPYEIVTSYAAADVFEIQFIQINDIGYFVHPDYPPQKLSRFADTNWTLAEVDWTYPPLRDENVTDLELTPSAVSGSITVTASAAFFDAGMIDGFIQIGHDRLANEYQTKIALGATNGESSEILIQGEYSFFTSGIWTGDVTIQRYDDDAAAWVDVRTFESDNGDQNYETGGEFDELTRVRIKWVKEPSWTTANKPRAVLEAGSSRLNGLVKITAVASATSATATVVKRLAKTDATKLWREGAFSDFRGFPRTVGIHDMRVAYGGTNTDRQTIWGSAIDDYENFEPGTKDADSFKLTIASGAHDEIEWLLSQKSLLVGTSGGEWVLSSGSDETVITPTNARARRQSNYGSEHRQALVVDDAALFLRSGGERLAEMAYFFEADGYKSNDLTLLSYDVGSGGFRQLAYKRKREPAIFGVTEEGKLAAMAYNRGQEITGWTTLETDGEIESVAVLSKSGDEDEVWIAVKRVLPDGGAGTTVRYIERIDPDSWTKVEAGAHTMCFVDSAVIYEGAGVTTMTGLGHLEGKTVAILADGATHPSKLVVGGEIELDYECETLVAGIPFECRMVPLPRGGSGGNGAILGREYKLNELVFFFYRTISTKFGRRGAADDELTDIPFRTTAGNYGEPVELFTGPLRVKTGGKHEIDAGIELRSDEPFPFTLTGLVTKFDVVGN